MHYAAMQRVADHAFVDFVDSATDGFDESAASDDSIKFQRRLRAP